MRERFADSESFSRIRPKGASRRGRKADRFDDAEPEYLYFPTDAPEFEPEAESDSEGWDEETPSVSDGPAVGDRWSTWDQSTPTEKGPEPRPDWVVTELAAVDTELGIVKTGKEADVFLLERAVPGTERRTLMAAKRYRDAQHRMFHRDSGYLEGRQHKESRVSRAMAKRTAFGKEAIAGQWAAAEFAALCRLWSAGVAVPYPVQITGTEILMEFVGDESGAAAPRLAQLRAEEADVEDLWAQLGRSLSLLAYDGYAHGDLSAYNILVHRGRLVIIDVPQIVDVVANPRGLSFLERDVRNVGAWFVSRGLPPERVEALVESLAEDARLRR
ncbi:serine protein kinase RIO [Kitasatospora cheerisanensis]|uniref:non-specific serine/threonine protein kinase n=1 Tax=Kitasatospora cheerisanensis KCTC 2395 TaxID=1348663 RepID=A0A066YYL0_9ACTN|nr:RIO1 family regulatory kinase/ATPase [Kitasatospora cheerisanensis]KDN86317.1 non-spific serine/threonine protein kinase [Kitasatospora cheerisanensis KCTC 2395]